MTQGGAASRERRVWTSVYERSGANVRGPCEPNRRVEFHVAMGRGTEAPAGRSWPRAGGQVMCGGGGGGDEALRRGLDAKGNQQSRERWPGNYRPLLWVG